MDMTMTRITFSDISEKVEKDGLERFFPSSYDDVMSIMVQTLIMMRMTLSRRSEKLTSMRAF